MSKRRVGGLTRKVQIEHGGRTIPISVMLKSSNRLSITVHPDQRVTATAPDGQPWEAVLDRLRARAGWIARQQREFESYKPAPTARRYVSGETHYYLGRQFRLKVERSAEPHVRLRGRYIVVGTPFARDSSRVRELVLRWYRDRAEDVLRRRLARCLQQLRTLNLAEPTPVVRVMRQRWGSCTRQGRVLLNPELVKVPVTCIDYVIVHELCHLKVWRHSPAFYRLLSRFLPDWERRRSRLNSFSIGEP